MELKKRKNNRLFIYLIGRVAGGGAVEQCSTLIDYPHYILFNQIKNRRWKKFDL